MRSRRKRWVELARGSSARSSSWALLGQGAAIVASLANFLLLARVLGPAEYGAVAGAWALVMAVSPLAVLGADRLLVRDISSRGSPAGSALGAALLTAAGGWIVVVGGLLALQPLLLPGTSLLLLTALAVSDIVAMTVSVLCVSLCFAMGNAKAAGLATALVNGAKLLAAVTFAVLGQSDPEQWALTYAACATAASVALLLWVVRRYGRPRLRGFHAVRRGRDGLPYSLHLMAGVVQNDADKTLLLRNGLATETGIYSVAYRLASMAYLPVLAVMQAMFPRFFAAGGEAGLRGTLALGRRLLPPLLTYAAAAGVLTVVAAPLIPALVGEQYEDSVPLAMLLAPLVLSRVGQSVIGDVLTGAGRQGTRTSCTGLSAAVNVGLNIVLIPTIGLPGVLISRLVADALLITLLVQAVRRGLRDEAPAQAAVPD